MKLFRALLGVLMPLLFLMPQKGFAVLKGEDLNQTVIMLNSELLYFADYVGHTNQRFHRERSAYREELEAFASELSAIKLTIYSQQDQYIFGHSYSLEYALKLCSDFQNEVNPADRWMVAYDRAIARCQKMEQTLQQIPDHQLNARAQEARQSAVESLEKILQLLGAWHNQLTEDRELYAQVKDQVEHLHTEITDNYAYLLKHVLFSADRSVPTIFKNSRENWQAMVMSFKAMRSAEYYAWEFRGEWAKVARTLLWNCLISLLIGAALGYLLYARWLRRRWARLRDFAPIFVVFCALVVLLVDIAVLRLTFVTNPFFVSALNLSFELVMLYAVVILSVMLRAKKELQYDTLSLYLPTMLLTAVVLIYRITLVNAQVVRITYPIVLLLFIVSQILVMLRGRHRVDLLDRLTAVVSLVCGLGCAFYSFRGYHFVAIHLALIYSIFITGHLSLSCLYFYLRRLKTQFMATHAENYKQTWFPYVVDRLVKPFALLFTIAFCAYECAHIFNMTEWLENFFSYKFINRPGMVCVSVDRVVGIIVGALMVNFLVGMADYLLYLKHKDMADVGVIGLSRKVYVLVAWGLFAIVSLTLLEVNSVGIIAALGGLAVGLGVALRDWFDCLLCGIVLMMGRIKIGDVVECGKDIRGKVIDIQYRTTLIETDDGAVISLFNNQFFGRDFRNVSLSGEYQRLHLTFKVQKEIDSPAVRQMLADALAERVPELAKTPAPKILFSGSDRFHVDMIAQVWVPVIGYYEAISNVKETLFNTLKEHGMSNMSVDSRVRIIKQIVENATPEEKC